MTKPVQIRFTEKPEDGVAARPGRVAVLVDRPAALRLLPRGAAQAARRAIDDKAWAELKPGEALELAFPAGRPRGCNWSSCRPAPMRRRPARPAPPSAPGWASRR